MTQLHNTQAWRERVNPSLHQEALSMAEPNLIGYRQAVLTDAARLWDLRRRSIRGLAPQGMSVEQADAWAVKATMEDIERKLRELEIWVAEPAATIVGGVAIRGDYLE